MNRHREGKTWSVTGLEQRHERIVTVLQKSSTRERSWPTGRNHCCANTDVQKSRVAHMVDYVETRTGERAAKYHLRLLNAAQCKSGAGGGLQAGWRGFLMRSRISFFSVARDDLLETVKANDEYERFFSICTFHRFGVRCACLCKFKFLQTQLEK